METSTAPPTAPGGKSGSASSSVSPLTKPFACPHCHQWESSTSDGYCGFCGRLLLSLKIQPDPLVLISALAPQRELILTNDCPEPLRAVLLPRTTPPLPGLSFEPSGPFEIPPGNSLAVKVWLEPESLPADLREETRQYICLVNDDRRKALPLRIIVKSGPRPHLLTPAIDFGEIREGTVTEKSLEIRNLGGIPLRIAEVRPDGSSRLCLAGKFSPFTLGAGDKLAIPFLWDGRREEMGSDPANARVHLRFDNHQGVLTVPARAQIFRYLLTFSPPEIHLTNVLSKQDYTLRVELENKGTTDVEIADLESDQTWVEVVRRTRGFTLLSGGSPASPEAASIPTAFRGRYSFAVVLHPQELKQGRHLATVTAVVVGQESAVLKIAIDVLTPKDYHDYIGIDFGTTNSVIAVLDPQKHEIELVKDGPEHAPSALIPSVLVFSEGATAYRVGHAARNEAPTAPDRTVRSIKRIMGYDHEREFFGKRFSPEDLAALIIKRLVELAEQRLREITGTYYGVRKAIVTVPANFFDLQIRGILSACEMAQLDTEREKALLAAQTRREVVGRSVNAGVILDEPSAAVLYYLHHMEESGGSTELLEEIDREGGLHLLVFDYGGGTLDVSVANVVRLEGGAAGLGILANMGNNQIGGDSIDLLVMRELLDRCEQEFADFDAGLIRPNYKDLELRRRQEGWSDETWARILGVRSDWKGLAEQVKIDMAERGEIQVKIFPSLIVHLENGQLQVAAAELKITLTDSRLADLLQPILKACQNLIASALDLAQLSPQKIDYILHTGRQSQFPPIRRCVKELFPSLSPSRDLLNPGLLKVCVAKGAALYGSMRDRLAEEQAGIHFLDEGRRLPHSYGVEKIVGLTRREFDQIIPRGATYPTSERKEYGPGMLAGGRWLNLKFYQNSGTRKSITRNPEISLVGEIAVDSLADGKPGCEVKFVIDANRKLEVEVDGIAVEIKPMRLQGEESWMG